MKYISPSREKINLLNSDCEFINKQHDPLQINKNNFINVESCPNLPNNFQKPLPKHFLLHWYKFKILKEIPQLQRNSLNSELSDSQSTTYANSGKNSKRESHDSFYVEISNESSPVKEAFVDLNES